MNTPDNFGVMGDKPSNPELLEWLADQFVITTNPSNGCSGEIMLSAAYQTTVEESPEAHDKDAATRSIRTSTASGSTPRRFATACSMWPAISI